MKIGCCTSRLEADHFSQISVILNALDFELVIIPDSNVQQIKKNIEEQPEKLDLLIGHENLIIELAKLKDPLFLPELIILSEVPVKELGCLVEAGLTLCSITVIDAIMLQDLYTTLQNRKCKRLFGMEYYLRHGCDIQSLTITNRATFEEGIRIIVEFVQKLGKTVGTKRFQEYSIRVKNIAEEMVLNAIFDSNPRKRLLNRDDDFILSEHEKVVLKFGFDGFVFGISIADSFGLLQRKDFFKYLTHTTPAKELTEKRSAGKGLQLIMNNCHALITNVNSGKKTEIIGLIYFDSRLRDYQARRKGVYFTMD